MMLNCENQFPFTLVYLSADCTFSQSVTPSHNLNKQTLFTNNDIIINQKIHLLPNVTLFVHDAISLLFIVLSQDLRFLKVERPVLECL